MKKVVKGKKPAVAADAGDKEELMEKELSVSYQLNKYCVTLCSATMSGYNFQCC